MVSYYNPMYRHQNSGSPPNPHFQTNGAMHSWYPGYHNGTQMGTPPATYLPQEEPQIWHHPGSGVFQHEFQDFVHTGIPPLQPHNIGDHESQLPSPPITVSGSEMSSPGGQNGNMSPPQQMTSIISRPPPARSPYEWIKKTSYQTQPHPGKTRTKDKYRVVYTDHQRIQLEKEFTFVNKYITIRRKTELAAELGLSERQVKIWFQNRRAKERKQNKKRIEEKSQIDNMYNVNIASQMLSQHQQSSMLGHQPHVDQHHQVLPTIVPPSTTVLQRFIHEQHQQQQSLKLESSNESSDQQLG